MSFKSGFMHALGFRIGMEISKAKEMEPISRKRLLATFLYTVLTVYCLYLSFSITTQPLQPHAIVSALEKIGISIRIPFVISVVFGFMTFFIVAITLVVGYQPGREITDPTWRGKLVITFAFICFSCILSYELAYYLFGNKCVPLINSFCFNIANHAGDFAIASIPVYLLCSTYALRPGEVGYLTNPIGRSLKRITIGGLQFAPSVPVPHPIRVVIIWTFDMTIGGWDVYHVPDGRSNASQIHHKKIPK
jgi:hypothetical protein